MPTPFIPSVTQSSIGVEWELSLVDTQTRALVSAATDVLGDICPPGKSSHPRAKPEMMQHTVEIITDVCGTVNEAANDLAQTLDEVQAAAGKRGLSLMSSGVHPFSTWWDQKVTDTNPRYQIMMERQEWGARRVQILGVHVHVGIKEPRMVIPILNAIREYLPHMLALSASSPYFHGRDTGMSSARASIFEGMSTAGLPPVLRDWAEYESVVETYFASGSIADMRQIWWDARPHPDFGTIELRICDGMATLDEISALTALTQCLVDRYTQLLKKGYTLPVPKSWIAKENKWRAARFGLDADFLVDDAGTLVSARDAISELVDDLMPTADRLSCAAELAGVERILAVGASYQRQRAVAKACGGDLTRVVDHLIAEMRDGLPKWTPRSQNLQQLTIP